MPVGGYDNPTLSISHQAIGEESEKIDLTKVIQYIVDQSLFWVNSLKELVLILVLMAQVLRDQPLQQ